MKDMIYFLAIRSQDGAVLMTQRLAITHWYNGQFHDDGVHIPLGGQSVLPFIIAGADGANVDDILRQWEQQSGVAIGDLPFTQFSLGRSTTLIEVVAPALGDLVKQIGSRVAGASDGRGPAYQQLGLWAFDRVEARPQSELMRLANAVVIPSLPAERYQYYLTIHFEHLMVCSRLASRSPGGETAAPQPPMPDPLAPNSAPSTPGGDLPTVLLDGSGNLVPLREEDA